MYRQMNRRPSVQAATVETAPARTAPVSVAADGVHSPAFRRAIQMANNGDCKAALQLLRPQGHDPETMNATGVCLLRLGKIGEAVVLYRGMVMKPGCTWLRPEVPTLYKINYATALLLNGTPAGCLSVLNEIRDPDHPTVQRLFGAIKKWEATLPFWRRWDWRISRIEPPRCQVPLGFTPGEFSHQTLRADVAQVVLR